MTRKLYLLPIIVLIFSIASGWVIANKRITAVENFIQASFDKGEPVIVTWNPDRLSWPVRLHNLNGEIIPLGTNEIGTKGRSVSCIRNSGNRLLFWYYTRNGDTKELWKIKIPSGRPYRIGVMESNNMVPDKILNTDLLPYRDSDNVALYRLDITDGNALLIDFTANTSTPVFETWFPFFESGERTLDEQIKYSITPDGGTIFITPSCISDESGSKIIWIYDVESDTWEEWLDWTESNLIVPNKSGTVVVLEEWQPYPNPGHLVFFDVETREALHRVENASDPVLGNRWAVCFDESGAKAHPLIVFDMEHDWQRYDVPLDSGLASDYQYIILEPPG